MSKFIINAAEDADMVSDDDEQEEHSDGENDLIFIGHETNFKDQEPSNYRSLLVNQEPPPENVTVSYEEVMALSDTEYCNECSDQENFVKHSPPEWEFNEFQGWNERIDKFNKFLKQIDENSKDSFFNTVVWGTYFKLECKKATFEGDLQQGFGTVLLDKFYGLKNELVLDNIL